MTLCQEALTKQWWLRLKATLERVQRLAHSYTDQLLAVYPDRVQALGKGLAMDQERLKVTAPADALCLLGLLQEP